MSPISTAVDASAVARVVGIETIFKDLRGGGILFLPQRVAVIGQGSTGVTYDTTKRQVTSAAEVGGLYGFGSPLYLACLQLFPTNGDGVGTIPVTVYPLEDDGSGVAASGAVAPAGAPTKAAAYQVVVNGIESETFVISVGDDTSTIVSNMTEAINAVLEMPVHASDNATDVLIESKWAGESANSIILTVTGDTDAGNTFGITQPAGGLVNPDVTDALDQIGGVWETMVLSCLNVEDTATLDLYQTFGEGRHGALVRKPLVVFTGTTEADVTTAVTVPDARKTDRVNCQLVAPGSVNLPLSVAARELARIVKVANNTPPWDYGSQSATGLEPGTDGEQWNYLQRDLAVKAGSSTVEVRDGVVTVADTVTFYHPTGEPIPGYRFVCDIVKIQNIIFNLDLIFATPEWDGAPLIPDNQPTYNRTAKKPKMAVAAVCSMIDSLGLEAFISDPDAAKAATVAEIDSQNPKRLNLVTTMQLAGNTNIISIDFEFGFYFGTQTVVA